MILAAGRGTRLLPLTERVPKPMIPIHSEPLIVHQLRWLRRAGITDVVINLHHLANQISDFLGDGSQWGVRIQYSVEEELLDTGGGIVRALPLLGNERFAVLNSDVWTSYRLVPPGDVDDSSMHLVLVERPAHRFEGDFGLEGQTVIRPPEITHRHWVYSGIAYIHPKVFDGFNRSRFSLRDVMFHEVALGRVSGEIFRGVWFDTGTHEELDRLRLSQL